MKIFELILIFLILLGIAIVANWSRRKTFDSYILADRKIPSILVGFTLIGTYVGGGTLIGMAGKMSEVGIAFICVPIGVALGFFFLGKFSSLYRHSRNEEITAKTLVQRLSYEYGKKVRLWAFIVISVLMILFMASQLYVGSLLIQNHLKLDQLSCALIFGLMVLVYTVVGGTKGDIWTDFIQVLIVVLSILVGFFVLIGSNLNIPVLIENVRQVDVNLLNILSMGIFFLIGSLFLPTFAIHTDGGIQQKLLISKSDKEAKKGSYIAALVYFIFGIVLLFLIIISITNQGVVAGDRIIFQIAENVLPGPFIFLFNLVILCAVLSTIDSEMLLVSGMFVNDIYVPFIQNRFGATLENDDERQYKLARSWVVVCFIISFGIVFLIKGLFDLISALWVLGIGCFGLPLMGLLLKKLREKITTSFVKYEIIWSAIIVGLGFIWAVKKNLDVTTIMVQLGMLLLILNFMLMWIFYIFRKNNHHNI